MTPTSRPIGTHFVLFVLIGAGGTVAHYLTLAALVEGLGVGPVLASQAGALVGAVVNYGLNRWINYRSSASHLRTGPRFFLVAAVAFVINGACMSLAANALGLHYLVSQVLATAVVLAWTFAANHWWTFRAAS